MLKLQFKDNANRSLWLAGEKLTLGADADNDVMLDGLGIDPFHAKLEINDSGVHLASEAGSCFVNDMPVDERYSLNPGDELRIGQHRMLVLTPQQADELRKSANDSGVHPAAEASGTGWSLQAEHSKLRDTPYPIAVKSVLGRSKDCDLAVPYKLLSRHHVEFTVREGQLFMQDLGSANGSYVNGQRVEQARLEAGDTLSFAKLAFTVDGPASKETELNKTMIRPAVDIQAELKKAAGGEQPSQHSSGDLGVEASPEDAPEVSSSTSKLPMTLGAGLLVLVLIAAFWFLGGA